MKIGVISDTHIPERAQELPKELLAGFKDVDMIIHAGDFVDLSVLEILKNICGNVRAVYGNMDSHELKRLLPEKEVIKAGSFIIGVMHGCGPAARLPVILEESFKGDHVDVVVFGHSHASFNEKKKGILFFNPGSPTDKIFSVYNSYGIIEINSKIEARIIRL